MNTTPPPPKGPSFLPMPPDSPITHLANNVAALVAAQHEANQIARAVALLEAVKSPAAVPRHDERDRLRAYALRLLDNEEKGS